MKNDLIFYNFELEQAVRDELLIYDRPITTADALNVFNLDCSDFSFDARDYEALKAFKNLVSLDINTRADELNFLNFLPLLEVLYLETWSTDNYVDFNCFSNLKSLRTLTVSGGLYSDIQFRNLEGLKTLKNLKSLTLHEFGDVDLSPLREMPWLEDFCCCYGCCVENVSAISSIVNLKGLSLIDFEVDNLEFLDAFSDELVVELSAMRVKQGIDYSKLSRFTKGDFDDIESIY